MRSYVAQIIASKVVGPSAPPGPAPEPLSFETTFAARPATTQALSSNVITGITLGTEVYDTGNQFESSQFVVGSGDAGKYAILTFVVRFTTGENNASAQVLRSRDSGATWQTMAMRSNNQSGTSIVASTGLVKLEDGDIFRGFASSTSSATIATTDGTTRLSAFILG